MTIYKKIDSEQIVVNLLGKIIFQKIVQNHNWQNLNCIDPEQIAKKGCHNL